MDKPRVQFTRTRDGVTIAYSATGQGPAIIFLTAWVSHLETTAFDEEAISRFLGGLGAGGRRRLVRFDWRGTGLSDRQVTDISVAARVADLEAVIDALGPEPVAIFAWAMSGPPAIVYAATHPERVSHLILYGTFAQSVFPNLALGRALVDLIRADWDVGARSLVQFVVPGLDTRGIEQGADFLRKSASAETAAALLEEGFFNTDVREYVPRVRVRALVMHRRDDPGVPFAGGRALAALLPDAQFVPLVGNQSNPFYGDREAILAVVDEFLGDAGRPAESPAGEGGELLTILFTDLVDSTALTQRLGDAAAQEVLHTHNAIIRERLREHGGSELKTTGDGFMASFPSATRALDCAIAIQRSFAAHNDERHGEAIRVRVGINAGEPVAEASDLFGTAVQAAARIADRARAGQILVSDVVRQLAAGKTYRFHRIGAVQLKGFRERVKLFLVEH